jgi:cellulose synthase/poly-beta-1,6-N-acetylglucosamine synthase-like glycosyltransferase
MSCDDYVICIPSYNRIECLKNKTLNMLEEYNIDKNKIYIYVVLDEYLDYLKAFPEYRVIMGEKGIKKQRDFILKHQVNKNVVMIDDDIEKLIEKDNNEIDLDKIIKLGFSECDKNNTKLWGIYAVPNPFFMKNTITSDLKFIVGCLFGVVNNTGNSFMLWNENDCEDFARTLHFYNIYNSVVRINYIAPKTKYYTEKGGLQDLYTKEQRIENETILFKKLADKYPNFTRLDKKKNGHSILRLHHYKNEKMKK